MLTEEQNNVKVLLFICFAEIYFTLEVIILSLISATKI